MNDWAELESALEALVASGNAEVREDGEWLAELASLHCELRCHGKTPLIHLWSDQKNLTRQILGVLERSSERLVFEVRRFGRSRPGRLEFLRTDGHRSPARITREQFRSRLGRFLAECFPDASIDPFTTAPDLEHSFSRLYARGRMREKNRIWAVVAISPYEDVNSVEDMLAFGLLWLEWVRDRETKRAVQGLRLLVPEGRGEFLRQRALALSSVAHAEVFEFNEPEGRMQKMDLADAGNLESWLTPRREMEAALEAARQAAARSHILAANGAGEKVAPITERFSPGAKEVAFCFRGLEFARWTQNRILFGMGDSRKPLMQSNEGPLERLVHHLDQHRNSLTEETNHAFYRAEPERWLETLILEDPTTLDAQLDPRFLYSQVPAFTARDRSVLDLLGVTRRGRLVVIELKASEDLQMPLQAVDYWLRVRRHQTEGDFQRCGYFDGIGIDPRPPLVWLVAPGLRFHSAVEILLKYLSSEISITRIGLNENWRRGLNVVFRHEHPSGTGHGD